MKNVRGAGVYIGVDSLGREKSAETITCPHCNRVNVKPAPGEPYAFCHRCMQQTCMHPVCANRCRPFELALENSEARARFLASL